MSWLLKFTLQLVVLFLFSICDIYGRVNQALFWELKPYIWMEEGRMKGILPSVFHNAKVHCSPLTKGETLDFKVKFKGYEEFNNVLASNVSYGEGILKNITNIGEPFWMPFLVQHEKIKPLELEARNVTLHVIASASSVSVVVSRREINLPVKLIRGIQSCGSIVSIAFMLSTLFGALIWILERNNGSDFNDCIYNGLWWSQVTMTTTGYGDFVPITGLGKLAASIWMFCGIIVVAVTTATVSDSVNGLNGLGIRKKTVAVLKNSFEELIASRDFESTTVSCSSYEDVYEAVKNGNAFAALVNTDVLAWGLEKLTDNTARKNPLSVIQHIPAEFPITFAGKIVNKTTDPFFDCVFKMYEREILIWTQKFFKKYVETETIYIGQIYETLFDDPIFLTLTCAAGLLLVLCVLHEIMKCYKGKKQSKGVSFRNDGK